jgi:hypothetical protein
MFWLINLVQPCAVRHPSSVTWNPIRGADKTKGACRKERLVLALCLAVMATPASTREFEIIGRWQCGLDYIERVAPDYGRSLFVYKNQTAKKHSDFEEALVGKGLGAPARFMPYYDQKENGCTRRAGVVSKSNRWRSRNEVDGNTRHSSAGVGPDCACVVSVAAGRRQSCKSCDGISLYRVREWGPDLFGKAQNRQRVIRTSNAYVLIDPQKAVRVSESKRQTGTEGQESFPLAGSALDPDNGLHAALLRST